MMWNERGTPTSSSLHTPSNQKSTMVKKENNKRKKGERGQEARHQNTEEKEKQKQEGDEVERLKPMRLKDL